MNNAIIQVPVKTNLKIEATATAKAMGFSSLQELLRVLMTKLVKKQINISFEGYPQIKLSRKNDRRYTKMEKDYKEGKNFVSFKDVDSAVAYLNGNQV